MRTILIVENHAAVRHWLARIIHDTAPGARIVMIDGGAELYSAVEYYEPDLVFMDVRLAGLNGIEATRVLKARGCAAPVAILTNCDLPEYRDAALSAGASNFLVKGNVTVSTIADLVASVVRPEESAPSVCKSLGQVPMRPQWRPAPITLST